MARWMFVLPWCSATGKFVTSWHEFTAIVEWAENDSWDFLPPQYPQVTFQVLLDAVLPDHSMRNRVAVNIGAQDGKEHDPTFALFETEGYGGIAIEADELWYPNLTANLAAVNSSSNIFAVIESVQPFTINELLKRYKTPHDFDCLKIDIDSFDLPVLRGILQTGYAPKIIMIEANLDIPPPFQFSMEYDPNFVFSEDASRNGLFGASPDAIFQEASSRGYSLIAFESLAPTGCKECEHNMWFVRNDLLNRSEPWVSWRGMVRMYWAQVSNRPCTHIHVCPRNHIEYIVDELAGGVHFQWKQQQRAKMSIYLAQSESRILKGTAGYAKIWAWRLEELCRSPCKLVTDVTYYPVHSLPVTSSIGDVLCWMDHLSGALMPSDFHSFCCRDRKESERAGCWDEDLTFGRCCLGEPELGTWVKHHVGV